jgi:hypothetical protein
LAPPHSGISEQSEVAIVWRIRDMPSSKSHTGTFKKGREKGNDIVEEMALFDAKIAEASLVLKKLNSLRSEENLPTIAIPPEAMPTLTWTLEEFLKRDLNSKARERPLAARLCCQLSLHLERTPTVYDAIGCRRGRFGASLVDRKGNQVGSGIGERTIEYLENRLAAHGLRLGLLPTEPN